MGFRLVRPGNDAKAPNEVTLIINGIEARVPAGITVAAALLLTGMERAPAAASTSLRAPYCMMGVCFECLASIDGIPGRQSCLVEVRDAMHVERGTAALQREMDDA